MKLGQTRGAIAIGLIVIALCATASASVPPPVKTVVLTIHHSHFSIAQLHVKRGQEVRFVVRNTDPIDHELIVGPMPVQLMHEAGRRRWHPPVPGEVSVKLFHTASTTYTFDQPGTILFACHLPGHWAYGMQGKVIVG